MSTSAPQMPVKIITALWFSILAAGFSTNLKPEMTGKLDDLRAAEDCHGLTGLSGMIIHADYDGDDSNVLPEASNQHKRPGHVQVTGNLDKLQKLQSGRKPPKGPS